MTVQIPKLSSSFFGETMMGGEIQRSSLTHDTGYSETAQCTGTPSYLEPNSQSMLKTIEGLSLLVFLAVNSMLEKQRRNYLDHIRNRMQKPVEGLSSPCCLLYIKEGYQTESNRAQQKPKQATRKHTEVHAATSGSRKDPIYERQGSTKLILTRMNEVSA